MPALVVLSSTCEVEVWDGVDLVRGAYGKAVRQWCKGKCLFWSREAREGEYVWDGVICHQCYMSPIIGSRHGCTDQQCYVDYCETCLHKTKHEHSLVQYLTPKRQYSLEELFKSVPYILNPNNDAKIQTKTLWENDVRSVIAFYFSAHWCGPCRDLTPKLAEVYTEAQINCLSFRIVFVSSDFNEESFNQYRSEMPWPAVPLNSGHLLDTYFQSSCKSLFDLLVLYKKFLFLSLKIFQDCSSFHQMENFYHLLVLKIFHEKE